jgi:hypothetical protein
MQKRSRHPPQSVLRQSFLEDLEIARFQVTGVLPHLVEVRINAPLADLMTHHRDVTRLDVVTIVDPGCRRFPVDARFQALTPGLNARVRSGMPLILRDLRPARRRRPETTRIHGSKMLHVRGQIGGVFGTARLVAVRHQDERRMVPVGPEDAIGLLVHPAVHGLSISQRRRGIRPTRSLHVQVHPQFIGRHEGRFRRAIRMEPKVVQPMALGRLNDPPPRRHIHRG